jgi:hypothetical protein
MADAQIPEIVLYTRQGCTLCEETRENLLALLGQRVAEGLTAPHLVERDIDSDPALELAFFDRIPVVELGGRRVELAIGIVKLRKLLTEVLDRPATESRP